MKAYMNNKKYSNLHLHQSFNKRVWPMKRERTHRILHHFSFGERFDETMMNAYCVGNKYIAYANHQFFGFLSTNKPAGKVVEVKITIRRPDGRMSDLPTCKEKHIASEQRKRPLITYRHFRRLLRNRKAIANKPTGLHPSGHPRLPCGMTAAGRQ